MRSACRIGLFLSIGIRGEYLPRQVPTTAQDTQLGLVDEAGFLARPGKLAAPVQAVRPSRQAVTEDIPQAVPAVVAQRQDLRNLGKPAPPVIEPRLARNDFPIIAIILVGMSCLG